jgi:PAS domain S-box-containing protein
MLTTVGRAVDPDLTLDDLLSGLYEQIQALANPSIFYIALCNEQQEQLDFILVMEYGQRQKWPSRNLSPADPLHHMFRSRQPVVMRREQDNPDYPNGLRLFNEPVEHAWALPLVFKDKVLGVMALADYQPNPAFSDSGTQRLLPMIAQQAAMAVRSTALFDNSGELAEGLSLINQSMQTTLFTTDSDKALRVACKTAIAIVKAQKAAVFLVEKGRNRLRLYQEIGLPDAFYHWFSIRPFYMETHPSLPYVVDDVRGVETSDYVRDMAEKGEFRAFAEIPLRSSGEFSGLLVVYHDSPHHYRKGELDLLETLANHIAAGMDNVRLFDALEVYAFEMAQLVHLSQISTASLNLDEVSQNVTEILRQMTGMHRVTLLLPDPLTMELRPLANSDQDKKHVPFDYQPLALANLPEIRALVIQPLAQPQAFEEGDKRLSPGMNDLLRSRGETVMAVVPLVIKNALIGVIFLGSREDRFFSDREWQFIETAANHIAAQIYNSRLYNETQEALKRRLDQLSRIEHIARQISGSLSFNEVIGNVLEAALQTLQADFACLALVTKANEFWVIAQRIQDGEREKEFGSQPMDKGIISLVSRTGQAIIVPDNAANSDYLTRYPQQYQSSIAVPLGQESAIIGVLNVESVRPNFFTEEHASFLKNLAEHAVISIENARYLEERQYQIDTLTALRKLSMELSSVVDTGSVVQLVLQTALDILHGQYAVVFRYNEGSGEISFLGELQSADDYYISSAVDLLAFAVQATTSGELQTVESSQPGDSGVTQYTAFVAIPLKSSNRVRAVLCMAFNGRLDLQDRDLNAIDLLAGQAAGHLENAWLNEQVRANSEQMRAILDSTKDGIILLDREGRLVQSNPSAQYLLGMQLDEHLNENFIHLLEQHVAAGEIDGEGYAPEEIRNMWRMLRLEPQRITRRQFERKRQGQPLYIEEIGSPVLNTESKIIGRLLVLRDITQEKQLKAFQDKITNSVVHDLRSPLGAIISSLKIAQDNLHAPDSTATIEKTLVWASESARRLIDLVNTMLEIARMETMQLPLNRDPVSIRQLAESAYMALVTTAQEAGITVDFDIPVNLPPVFVDGDKIQRVLINLIHNALRFTPTGGQILISASYQVNARKVLARVADSGSGIPPNERENIFEKFRQVEGSMPLRGGKGSGLGLTFCKLVLEAHEERIWVEEKSPLAGACFAFTLPVATDLSVIG